MQAHFAGLMRWLHSNKQSMHPSQMHEVFELGVKMKLNEMHTFSRLLPHV